MHVLASAVPVLSTSTSHHHCGSTSAIVDMGSHVPHISPLRVRCVVAGEALLAALGVCSCCRLLGPLLLRRVRDTLTHVHVDADLSGIAALLKNLHPDWSAAAMKSAMTTSDTVDRIGLPIKDEQYRHATFCGSLVS